MLICTLETFVQIGVFSFVAGFATPFLIIGGAKAWNRRKK